MTIVKNTSPNYKVPLLLKLKTFILDIMYGGKRLDFEVQTPFSRQGIYNSQCTEYDELFQVFSKLQISKNDVLVDVGCGNGRVLNFILHKRICKKIIGIEIDPELCNFTTKRLYKYKKIEINCGDILENLPENATVFYMFNPFDELYLYRFIQEIEKKYKTVRIIYLNAVFDSVFKERKNWEEINSFKVSCSTRNIFFICKYFEYNKGD